MLQQNFVHFHTHVWHLDLNQKKRMSTVIVIKLRVHGCEYGSTECVRVERFFIVWQLDWTCLLASQTAEIL